MPARIRRAPRRLEAARIAPRTDSDRRENQDIEISGLARNPIRTVAEVILMAAFDSRADVPQAWVMRAERARRIASMLTRKDAEAIEAYARECEARAKQTVERKVVPPLAA
jgi:hypothetical protein